MNIYIFLGAAWVYLILGARERANKHQHDIGLSIARLPNHVGVTATGTEYWDYYYNNNNGNTLEDRVSASSGIASANSSSMPWGLPDLGTNSTTGPSYGPQVNLYHPKSTSPSRRELQENSLDQELRDLAIANSPPPLSTTFCKCDQVAIQTQRGSLFQHNPSSVQASCALHGFSANNHSISKARFNQLSSTQSSPHSHGLPQVLRNDYIPRNRQRHFSPNIKNVGQDSPSGYLTNGDTSQSSTIGSAILQQDSLCNQNSDSICTTNPTNIRVNNECLTETTDCPSEISVLTATTNTTAGPLLSSRRESTRKSKKSVALSDVDNAPNIKNNEMHPSIHSKDSMLSAGPSSKIGKYIKDTGNIANRKITQFMLII